MKDYNSVMFMKVNRISEHDLSAECTLLSDDREASGWLLVQVKDLKIKQAGWAVYRSPDGRLGYHELPQLVGVEAYLNSGPDLKRVLGGEDQVLARSLLSECIRGVVQAETFFFTERGFASAAEYDAFWDRMYVDACYYYSHLDRIEKLWMDYAGSAERRYNLFNRAKTVHVCTTDDGYLIDGIFMDSFHELNIRIKSDPAGMIKELRGGYTSAPDKVCWDNTRHFGKFIGLKLPGLSKKEIAVRAGGPEGCNHLVDIIYEASEVFMSALAKMDK